MTNKSTETEVDYFEISGVRFFDLRQLERVNKEKNNMKAIYKALIDTLVQIGIFAVFILIVILIVQGLTILTMSVTISFEMQVICMLILLGVATIGILLIPIVIFYENYNYYRRQK